MAAFWVFIALLQNNPQCSLLTMVTTMTEPASTFHLKA